ncbi:MAG: hypothetical protein KDE47_24730 [Caldilineaceae bacterium]|nr:hypothetical protein [Caldilineaceae bacterium]MCB0095786.1 hypothetical protein [Caldilineaceae bacterium]
MQTQFVRCVDNSNQEGSLTLGDVYRIVNRPTASDATVVVLDNSYGEEGSEIGYIFDKARFEPVTMAELQGKAVKQATLHMDELTWLYLRDAAHEQNITVSQLLRQWVKEHLDLPAA